MPRRRHGRLHLEADPPRERARPGDAAARAVPTTRPRKRHRHGGRAYRRRVLVVDDTPFNRRLLVRLLATIGHEAVEASDGREALAMLRDPDAPPIDVVLLDIVMPEMDGYETLAAIKADEALRDLPVIVISGVDELDSVVRCIRMGPPTTCPRRSIRRSCAPGSRPRWPRSGCGTSSTRRSNSRRPSTTCCGS